MSFREFYSLKPEEAAAGRRIRIRAVVVCSDRDWGELYVHDGRETLYLDPARFERQYEPGETVELTAMTTNAAGRVELAGANLKGLGKTDLPPASRLELAALGQDEGQWVEVTGNVCEADVSTGRLALEIEDQGASCLVYVLGPPGTNDLVRFLGSRVRVRGIDSSQARNGRVEKAILSVSGLAEVVTIGEAPADWRGLPVISIEALVNRELGDWTNRPVHLNGLVAAYKPGDSVVIRDSTGVITARIRQRSPAKRLERVDVWGCLRVTPAGAELSDAFFMVAHPRIQQAPVAAAAGHETRGAIHRTNIITEVSAVQRLKNAEAALRLPVHLRGVITFSEPEWGQGFLQDGTGAVYIKYSQGPLESGQWVDLIGETEPGGYAPEVKADRVEILGRTNLPTPIRAELDDLADGALDSYWVKMVGVVRRMELDGDGRLTLHLTTHKGRFKAMVRGFSSRPLPSHLVDALVSVEGACTSELNGRGQLSGVTLNVPGLERVTLIEAAPADPFATPPTPIHTISTYVPRRSPSRRIRLSGVVTMVQRGLGFWMQDATGGIRIYSQQEGEPQPGDRVDVLGFPGVGEFAPHIEEGVWRRTGGGSLPRAQPTTAQEILLHGTNDASLVELEAELLQRPAGSARPRLVLQDGPITFTAQLLTGAQSRELLALEPESRVRLRGVCIIQASEDHEPVAFRLLVANVKDVTVVRPPPWWTARHTLRVAAVLAVTVLLAIAWVAALRKRVRAQTEEIRQKLEERNQFAESLAREKTLLATLIDHLPDMVFVKDTQARYVLTNSAHTQFHGVASSSCFLGKSAADLMPPELARTYAQADRQILEEGRPVCEGEEPARNGAGACRWIFTTKVPLKNPDGKVIGLVGISRDITERKEAQARLEQTHKALVIASREAGMAEVATSVLHNVGNVLNSVNVSANLVADRLKNLAANDLVRIARLIQEHEADLGAFITHDRRGRQLPTFIEQLAKRHSEERKGILRELDSLRQNIEHIKTIVAMQQNYARVAGVQEVVHPRDLMEDALQMSAAALLRHEVQVERGYDPAVPQVQVEKHKVLQILVNLIRNAKYACDESGRPDKRITVQVTRENGRILLSVADNGVGIPPENLTRIFNHGFTTRKHGHGFGLHSGAIAAQEMGGSLTVRSEGLGHGACFTLELPAITADAPPRPNVAPPPPTDPTA